MKYSSASVWGAASGTTVSFPGSLPISLRLRALQLDDARRLGIDAEVERQLAAALCLQRSEDGAERRRPQLGTHVANQEEIREWVVRFSVGPHDRTNQSPFLQVPKMVFAESGIHAQQIALPVVLLFEIFRRLNAGHPAEVVLGDDAHAEIFRFPLLLTFFCVGARFSANHDECGPGRHLVGRGAAQTDHQRLCFLAAERRKFAGEDDELIGKWEFRRLRGHGWAAPLRGIAELRRLAAARLHLTRAEARKMQ